MRFNILVTTLLSLTVFSASCQADVTALSTNVNAGDATVLVFQFTTTGLGGGQFSQIKLFGSSATTTGTLTLSGGDTITNQSGTFSYNNQSNTFLNLTGGITSFTLTENKVYTLALSGALTSGGLGFSTGSAITIDQPDRILSTSNYSDGEFAFAVAFNPTSVPEPSILLLTGGTISLGIFTRFFRNKKITVKTDSDNQPKEL